MRALTIKQPWASLIMAGVKDVENRSWPVPIGLEDDTGRCVVLPSGKVRPFRLAIHAGKADTDNDRSVPRMAWDALSDVIGGDAPVRGALLGSVLVTGLHHADECYPEEHRRHLGDGWWHDSCLACLRRRRSGGRGLCSPWAEPDVYHWTMADPQPLPEPVPMKGRQRLWTVPDDVPVPA